MSSVNGEWTPKGSEVKSKNNGLPQLHSSPSMTMLVAKLFRPVLTAQLSLEKRIKIPMYYIPKVPANVRLQGVLNVKSVWFGVWVFFSPSI